MNSKYVRITQGCTQTTTAERILDYILTHPDEWPNDTDNTAPSHLVFRLDGGEAAVDCTELTSTWMCFMPGACSDRHEESGWTPSTIGNGTMVDRLTLRDPDGRPEAVRRIRLSIGRALRYQAKQAARAAAYAAAND